MSTKHEKKAYIYWVSSITGREDKGSPIDTISAIAHCARAQEKYPDINHYLVPVQENDTDEHSQENNHE